MAFYSINYELKERSPRDYINVINAIKGASNGNFKQMLGTFWLIESSATAKEIYNHLAQCMRKGDALMVQRVTNEFACALPVDCVNWLQKGMQPDAGPAFPACPPLDLP